MYSRLLSASAVALAAAGLASAQTYSSCNPVKGDKCPADPAAPASTSIDFTKGASDFFNLAAGTTLNYDGQDGAVFTIDKEGQAPTITSKSYIFFGKVDVWVRAANGTGIVTSCVLQSDDLDEIDWEWLGGDTTEVQTNYFSKGDTSTYNRGGNSSVSDPQATWHKYTVDWTNSSVVWLIDDVAVRTLTYEDANGGATFPQTPMQLKLGTWVGGSSTAPIGTVQWAGGYTNFAEAPFVGYYKQINIENYSNGVSGATSYVYGGTSGTYQSIEVQTNGDSGSSSSSSSSSSTASSSTSSSPKSSPTTTLSTTVSSTSSQSTVTPIVSSNTTGVSGVASGTGSGSGSATAASATPSSTATTAPNAAGNVAVTLGNVVAMGAAVLLASYVL